MFTGEFVRRQDLSGGRKASWMIAAAVALLVAGLAFNVVVPVNKSLWSSTFVCVVAAYSLAMFALFYYLIDVRGWRRWTLFFRVVGLNSITIYLAQRIVGFGRISDFFLGGRLLAVSLFPLQKERLSEGVACGFRQVLRAGAAGAEFASRPTDCIIKNHCYE